jgi:hypothetical protein
MTVTQHSPWSVEKAVVPMQLDLTLTPLLLRLAEHLAATSPSSV